MDEWLRAIVAKASSAQERLTEDFVPVADRSHDHLVNARMQAWISLVAAGDSATFQRRLDWDGLNESAARRMVGPVQLRSGAALPRWASTLAEVLRLAVPAAVRDRCLDQSEPVPYEDLLTPFVTWARSCCEREASSAYDCFGEVAHISLERQLLFSLSDLAVRPLLLEFCLERSTQESSLDLLLEREPSRKGYEAFVTRMLSGGLVSFFHEYSVLARVLSRTVELWVEATVEMLGRFQSDVERIREMVGVQCEVRVAGVVPSLSDYHRGLRSVAILTLESGHRVVYKPRAAGIEAVWNSLLDWFGSKGAPARFRTFRVLDRGDYGWAECVEYATCKQDEEARQYFVRAGALLAVVYLLSGTDCHADNVISAGAYPTLIDVETMLSPEIRIPEIGAAAPRAAHRRLASSVLCAYLLPFWSSHIAVDGDVFDGSGLGVDIDQEKALTFPRWTFVNTDRMQLVREAMGRTRFQRAAMADGRPLRVSDHEEELVSGFEAMYRFLMREGASIVGAESPFQRFKASQVRFVYRKTSFYTAILDGLKKPELLRDGADRSIEIEQLAIAALSGTKYDGRLGWMEIWNEERNAIDRGDIPYLSSTAGDDRLVLGPDHSVAGWFARPSHAAAIERLGHFDESDLAFQVDVIRSTLRFRKSNAPPSLAMRRRGLTSSTISKPEGDSESLLAEAISIAESIARDAERGTDGSVSWIQPAWSRELLVNGMKAELAVVGNDLYDGAAGIGLFIAAAERVAGGRGLRPVAIGAVRPLMLELKERSAETSKHMGIGGLSGLGSVVYGLVCMSKLLGDSELLHGADVAAALITPECIDADVAFDVTLGSAGALLGLLALYQTNDSESALDTAILCGKRLLAGLEPADPGTTRAIRTLNRRFLTGFSHGAAGIAYALSRLYDITHDQSLLSGINEIIEFERNSFSEEHGNWPDLREPGPPRFMAAWCHGAPGIALGRIGSLRTMDDEYTRREIDRALAITQQQNDEGADFLCCSTFGIVDVLWTAGTLLARPELCDHARSLARQTLARANERGGYSLGLPSVGQLQCRGLFQGLAGIGYTLLRLVKPDIVPELLLLR